MRILLVEDDSVLGAAVRDQIAGDGYSVDWVTRIDAARDAMAGAAYDLSTPEAAANSFVTAARTGSGDALLELACVGHLACVTEHIPGARLVKIEGMGHDYPRAVWKQWVSTWAAFAAGSR